MRSRDKDRVRSRDQDRERKRRRSKSAERTHKVSTPPESMEGRSEVFEEDLLSANITAKSAKPKHSSKKFDKMFGKKGQKDSAEEVKNVATAPEGSVEYWNQIRESMGMKKLRE